GGGDLFGELGAEAEQGGERDVERAIFGADLGEPGAACVAGEALGVEPVGREVVADLGGEPCKPAKAGRIGEGGADADQGLPQLGGVERGAERGGVAGGGPSMRGAVI